MTKGKIKSGTERLIDFAVRIIHLANALPKSKIGNHISGQMIRSGTSPAPNYGEAQDAESRSDFIHKSENHSKRAAKQGCNVSMIAGQNNATSNHP